MGLADQIMAQVRRGADEALMIAAHQVAERAKARMPVGDPAEDPDPTVSLEDRLIIFKEGSGVIISDEARYAAAQHENLRLTHPRGGEGKYLENALKEIMPRLEGIVASDVEARMASGLKTDVTRKHR